MNWDAIAAVGELLGAAGVIVSLLYLASQLRQNTVAVKTASAADAAKNMREITGPFLRSPEMSGLISRGFEDPASLGEDEKAWVINAVFNLLRSWETLHFQYTHGHAERETFESYERLYRQYLASPLLSEYWALRQGLFTTRFVSYVNGLAGGDEGSLRYKQVSDHLGGA